MKERELSGLWPALIRWSFWLLYNSLAWTYDWVSRAVSLGQWRRWQRTALPELRGSSVLELAFGTGNMLLDLANEGFEPLGIDLSPWMVDIARRKLAAHGKPVRLVRGRAQRLPFGNCAFDSVLCTFPTVFILEPGVLHEIARVLRPGGRLVVVVMAQLLGNDPWRRFVEWLYRITYQRGPLSDVQSSLPAYGLSGRVERVWVEKSVVWLVIANKS